MAGQHKALGRGLEALLAGRGDRPLPTAPTAAPAGATAGVHDVRDIPVAAIKPNRHQPRTQFDEASLEELAQSIRAHGLAQPLLVTETAPGEYELVAGERRLRASKLASLETVPCVVKKYTNRARFEVALVENIQREDLNALEEAVALDGLMREYNLTQEEVATAIGKSRSSVANTLRLLRLHEEVQAAVRENRISEGHAKVLAGVADHAEQLRLLDKVITGALSVRETEALVSDEKPSKKPGAASRPEVPEVRRYEEMFQRLLGRRVELKTNGTKGHLKIDFYSPEDLDALCGRLGLLDKPAE